MNDRFKFRIAVFERYKTEEWEFINFIENSDKVGISTSGNVIQANVQGLIIHLLREKTPKNVYRTMEAIQCTGLKDKNGKLIFEGDIVRFIYGNKKRLGYVEENKTVWSITNSNFCQGAWCGGALINLYETCEIIGNIYENPELLEDTECQK